MKILCDIDGILAQFTEQLTKGIRQYGERYDFEDFVHYDLRKVVDKKHHWILDRLPSDKNFCRSIPRYPGAQQFLKNIVAKGHELVLVTSPWTGPHWPETREEWVTSMLSSPTLRHIKWYWASPQERIEMDGHFLIDDRQETIDQWKQTHRPYACIKRPWNSGTCENYGEVLHLIDFAQATIHS